MTVFTKPPSPCSGGTLCRPGRVHGIRRSGAAAPTSADPALPAPSSSASKPTTPAPPSPSASPDPGARPLGWGPQQRDEDAAAAAVATMSPGAEGRTGPDALLQRHGRGAARSHHRAAAPCGLHHHGRQRSRATPQEQVESAAMAATTAPPGRRQPGGRPDVARPHRRGPGGRHGGQARRAPDGMAGAHELRRRRQRGAHEGRRQGVASELAPLGFNVDFAPDTDVTIGPADPTIGARSMSGNPDAAGRWAWHSPRGCRRQGVLPTVKHFPGHGSVTVDSHQDLPVQPATVADLEAPRLEALPGRHRRRCAHGHDGAHCRPGAGTRRSGVAVQPSLRGAAGHGLQGRGRDRRPQHGCRPKQYPGRLRRRGGARRRRGPPADAR